MLKSTKKYMRNQCVPLVVIFLVLVVPLLSVAADVSIIRIGTGGKTGVYYPIGKIIAQGFTMNNAVEGEKNSGENGVPGYIGVAQNSAGSIENALKVASGELEAGLVQADVALLAAQGEGVFKGNEQVRRLRAVASLYPEKFQIVVRNDANVHSVDDLRGKRISVDEIGSGTLAVMRIVLGAYNMTDKDLLPVYLKPVFTHGKIVSGDLQGFVAMAGTPMSAMKQLSDIGVSLVPVSSKVAARIEEQYAYLTPGIIPVGTYENVPEISTLQVHAILVVDELMDEELVYQMTSALWSQRTLSMLESGHPQGKFITMETAFDGLSIPLHSGAKKYYQEHQDNFNGSVQ